jgi:predicted dehydrogenase
MAKISRRNFVKSSAALGAFTFVPKHVLGANGTPSANSRPNIAVVGAGGKGKSDTKDASKESNIVALCDIDFERAAETVNNFPNAKKFHDWRIMFDEMDKQIDGVIISTPDHTHAVVAAEAIKRGKHVCVQKPLTHTVYESRYLTELARKHGVKTQMGNQGHCGEGIRLVCEWIWDGAIGDVREVHSWTDRPIWPQGNYVTLPEKPPFVPEHISWDLWLGPAPAIPYSEAIHPFKWRGYWDYGTGALGDMGCHIIDPVFEALKLGAPESVEASSSRYNEISGPAASIVHYTFPKRGDMPEVVVHWYDGGLLPMRPETMEIARRIGDNGVLFMGDKGILGCGCYGASPRLIPETDMQKYERPEKYLPRVNPSPHIDWVRGIADPSHVPCSNFEVSGPLSEMVLLGNLAPRFSGEKLLWDAKNLKFTNNDEATKLVHKEYREGWSL